MPSRLPRSSPPLDDAARHGFSDSCKGVVTGLWQQLHI